MKKIILSTILFAFAMTSVSAQMVTLADSVLTITGTVGESSDPEAHTAMTNVTQGELSLRWERETPDGTGPEAWDSWVCTVPGNCGLPNTLTLDFTIAAGEVGEFQYHVRPNDVAGMGTFVVNVINNANDEILQTVTINVDLLPLSSNEIEEAQITMYPNPATDFFQLENAQIVDQVLVYNILGREVRSFGANETSYFVGDLPKGIYLVKLTDEDSSSTKTLKLKIN